MSAPVLSSARSAVVGFLGSRRGAVLTTAVLVFLLVLLRGSVEVFVYDAGNYWRGTTELLTGGNYYEAGRLDLRGALTAFIYIPSVLVSLVFGESAGGPAVLVQNALLLAVLGAIILPRLAALVVAIRPTTVYVAGLLTALLFSGFAPYSLMDPWAAALVLLGVLLVCSSRRWWVILLGGIALGVALNIRPAYLAPVALGALIWLFYRWRLAPLAAAGAVLTLVPQVIINHLATGSLRPWPAMSFVLASTQSESASYVVRYDTVAYADALDPRLAYCNPDYAALVAQHPSPMGAGELARSFAENLPASLVYIAQKVSASLHWDFVMPYSDTAPVAFSPLTPVVIAVSVIGLLALVRHLALRRAVVSRPVIPVLLLVWFGTLGTLVFAQPESRFALMIVLVGVIGCLVLVSGGWRMPARSPANIVWAGAAVALAALILVSGISGLAHPAPRGEYFLSTCESLSR